jgi:predicted O-methyltransferase YrrM
MVEPGAIRLMSDGVQALEALLQVRHPLPRMRNWAIAPDFGFILYSTILRQRPLLTLELGPGVSTLIAAYALEELGSGQVISLEHRPESCDATLRQLQLHGLESRVKIMTAPLIVHSIGGEDFLWYRTESLSSLADHCADLLVVDGPPGTTNRLARYPALPLLRRYLSDHAVILVDDARRQDEREMIKRWQRDFELRAEFRQTEKGTAVLTTDDAVSEPRP